ncbi:MAG: hypothetical protein ABSG21_18655 [Spirochaetia bacterium]|jgi:hypothetical protein
MRKQIETRIQEPTKARAERVRLSIAELESVVSKDKSLFSEYQGSIQDALKKPEGEKKAALAGLVASLPPLLEGSIKKALSSVSQKALRSSVLVFASA